MRKFEFRPWGWFITLDEGKNYKVKKIYLKPNTQLSMQYHNHRTEDWVIVEGSGFVSTDIGLEGEALLGVSVSQPPLLKLVPKKILESTGHSVLNGILLGIKSRVQHQLVKDFLDWCELNKI